MKKLILTTLFVLSTAFTAQAARQRLDLTMGYEKVSEVQAQAFEKALGVEGIKCADVVSIRTGGQIATATASVCTFNDSVMYACRNDMLGTVSTSPEAPVDDRASTGLNLTAFILQNCIGG